MGYLEIKNLTKKFGEFTAVEDISLTVEKGEIIALLGGSGCGKTTILRMLAGFIEPYNGTISLEGNVINKIPAYKRNIGIFFQNYALFPHMTVLDNIAFSLKIKKMKKEQIKNKVEQILKMVRLEGLEKRYPKELSGGQQQRVALARALVMEPAVLLLDEPLSNLDAKLRVEMQLEIKRIQRELGITTIIVTHDQEEAISLADRVVIMNAGRILQKGTPREVFHYPSKLFVAEFMGVLNFFEGTAIHKQEKSLDIKLGKDYMIHSSHESIKEISKGDTVTAAIRPESIVVSESFTEGFYKGKIVSQTYKGTMTRLDIAGEGDLILHVNSSDYEGPDVGEEIYYSFPEDKVIIYKK